VGCCGRRRRPAGSTAAFLADATGRDSFLATFQLLQAVTSMLAGAPRSFALSWRLRLFRGIVWFNRRVAMVPTFDRATLPP
jgi:hypothetical protein